MVDRPSDRGRSGTLFAAALICGSLLGATLVGVSAWYRSSGPAYWSTVVEVPTTANASSPYVVDFHGATFSMWHPVIPPGVYSGVVGLSVVITEPSGTTDQTGTGCGACGPEQQTWYSNDGSVGITWYGAGLGDLTLLVRA